MQKSVKPTVALYIRLSVDDGNEIESNSVTNQRELLQQYVQSDPVLSAFKLIEFCDDGYSGTNFNRPSVIQLLEKVRGGHIQCIVVKDLSRFGRNYIEVGNYLEQVFPFLDVRFISLNDNYDSDNQASTALNGIEVALKTLLYDLYSKDLSVKVKSGLDAKKRRGEYAFGFTPYGYKKSLANKNKLEINEDTAKIVRYIFELTISGKGRSSVAKILNEQGISTRCGKEGSFWKRSDISEIIANEVYTGDLVYNKRRQLNVGGKTVEQPKEDWIVVPNTHPAIISKEIFDKANAERRKQPMPQAKQKKQTEPMPLKGKVRCHCCKYAMRRNGIKNPSYNCETPMVRNSPECVTIPVPESVIANIVLAELQGIVNPKNEIPLNNNSKVYERLVLLDKTLIRLESSRQELYEQYTDGELSKEEYLISKANVSGEIKKVKENRMLFESELAALTENQVLHQSNVRCLKDEGAIETLTAGLVNTYVDSVYVHRDGQIEVLIKK